MRVAAQARAAEGDMSEQTPTPFDRRTIMLLREILEDAWMRLGTTRQRQSAKSIMAERLLKAAGRGERDRTRLLRAALDVEFVQ
jgi:hypothetical protein